MATIQQIDQQIQRITNYPLGEYAQFVIACKQQAITLVALQSEAGGKKDPNTAYHFGSALHPKALVAQYGEQDKLWFLSIKRTFEKRFPQYTFCIMEMADVLAQQVKDLKAVRAKLVNVA